MDSVLGKNARLVLFMKAIYSSDCGYSDASVQLKSPNGHLK